VNTLVVRLARAEDVPELRRIRAAVRENRLVSRTIDADEYVREMTEPGRGFVAEADGVIVGFAVANASTGNVWALFVHPDHEGRGHGRRLHDRLVEWLLSREGPVPWLTTAPFTRAERFYLAAGWTLVGPTGRGEVRFELRGRRVPAADRA